jgi:hypothetical protein
MKVVVNWIEEGVLEVYEVDEGLFEGWLGELDPQRGEEWEELARLVRERGMLLYSVRPDYTITVGPD